MHHIIEKDLVKIATMYYQYGMTQAEIGKKIGVSRSLVSKLLIDARNKGIVEVFIKSPTKHAVYLENELEKKFDLHSAVVVDTYNLNQHEIDKNVGRNAALHLRKITKNIDKIGLSWGKSIRNLVDCYPYTDQSNMIIVPLIGGIGDDRGSIHSNQLCYDLAKKMRATERYLYVPALVSDLDIKENLKKNPTIVNVMEEARQVDLAIVGISSPIYKSTMETIGYINEEDIKEFKKLKAIGDENSRFFDINGDEIACKHNKYVMGINLKDLKKIPNVMSVAYGIEKVDAVRVALKQKLINIIVTTDEVATQLLVD